jgi:hypothetical protein
VIVSLDGNAAHEDTVFYENTKLERKERRRGEL